MKKKDHPDQQMLFGDRPVRATPPRRRAPPAPRPGTEVVHAEPDAEEEKVERCGACGQTIKKLNPHRMDRGKLRVLFDIALLEERRLKRLLAGEEPGQSWVHARAGDDLDVLSPDGKAVVDTKKTSYRAREHASRLEWFGLLDKGGPRSGAWRLNDSGRAFIAGELAVPPRIWCRDGEVIERDEGSVTIHDVKDVVLSAEYWDGYAEWQSYRGQ